jgi:hypothetical protein
MQKRLSPAETCRQNGWVVGDRLIGTEGEGGPHEHTTVIELTAIGERMILAKSVSDTAKYELGREGLWGLDNRVWRKV